MKPIVTKQLAMGYRNSEQGWMISGVYYQPSEEGLIKITRADGRFYAIPLDQEYSLQNMLRIIGMFEYLVKVNEDLLYDIFSELGESVFAESAVEEKGLRNLMDYAHANHCFNSPYEVTAYSPEELLDIVEDFKTSMLSVKTYGGIAMQNHEGLQEDEGD